MFLAQGSGEQAADGVVDAAGQGHLLLSDARTLFGPFGARTSEVATVYAGALTPALAVIALFRRPGTRRVPIALAAFGMIFPLPGSMAVPLRITVVPDGVANAVEAARRARSERRFIWEPFFSWNRAQ